MTDPIRWGILSTANIAKKAVIPAIQASESGVVAAVASRDEARARDFARELGILQAYGSYEALLADPDIDAVYIPLPNSAHAEWSIAAAEAGKPTLCEKPLASTAAEAQTMVEAFAARGVPLAEAFMYRFHPQTLRVKALIAQGAVGSVRMIDSTFTFAVRNEDNIRLSGDLAGGALMDVGCYCVNVMRYLTDEEPEAVAAQAQFGAGGVDETLAGLLGFPSGVMAHFDCSLRLDRRHRYEVRGTTGRIVVEEAFTLPADRDTVITLCRGDACEEIVIPAADHYRLMVEDFADALRNNRPPRFAPEDAVANMDAIDRLLADARGR